MGNSSKKWGESSKSIFKGLSTTETLKSYKIQFPSCGYKMQRPNPFWHPVLSSSLQYALDTGHKAFHSVLEIHLFYGVLQKSANSLSSRLSVKSVTPQIVRATPAEGKQAWLLNVERVIVKTSGFKFAPNRKFPTQSKATAPLPGLSRRTELKPFPFPL